MPRKEVVQVSAIHTLQTAQVPQPDDSALVTTYLERLQHSLLRKNSHTLKFVCQSLDCIPQKSGRTFKVDYAKALVVWVSLIPVIIMVYF
jgi:hypothetical protein